jgi:hypothetical protein
MKKTCCVLSSSLRHWKLLMPGIISVALISCNQPKQGNLQRPSFASYIDVLTAQ